MDWLDRSVALAGLIISAVALVHQFWNRRT